MMDIQDLHSPLPSSVSTFSYSSSSNSDLQPLSVGATKWQVGDNAARQILSIVQPNADSEVRREVIIEYLQRLIEDTFGIKVQTSFLSLFHLCLHWKFASPFYFEYWMT